MSDSDLAARAAAGDPAAFNALVREHQSRVRGFLRRLAHGDRALADDVAQEAFLEAWRKLGQFSGEGSFVAWLTSIAYRRFLMEIRRRKPEVLGDPPEETITPSLDLRLDLERAMGNLSVPERAALTLCGALEYTHEEGAEILGLPLGTLKSHIARGREKLREALDIPV